MGVQLADPTVTVNNQVVAIVPNSLVFTEGLGEQTIKAASLGGGGVEQIYAHNVETAFSSVKFEINSTVGNIEISKIWKNNRNQNVVQIAGQTPEGTMTRTFTQAALLTDTEKGLGSDTVIPLEFSANPAI